MKRSGIARKTRLRSRPRAPMTVEERRAADVFHRAALATRCVVCGKDKREAREAGTRLQAHHAIPQQTLRRRGLLSFLWDARNAVACCEEPCHRRHTTAVERIRRSALPACVEEFAAELGLTYVLERTYA